MADQDEIEVEIPDTEAPETTVEVKEEPKREAVPELEALRKQLEDERRARQLAESDARAART